MITLPDSTALIRSLASTTCPACGGPKRRSNTLCLTDYRRLSARVRASLYDRVGDGYEEALQEAFAQLGVSTFTMPPARPAPKPRGLFDV